MTHRTRCHTVVMTVFLVCFILAAPSSAQTYSHHQTLRASASGEGQPGLLHGYRVAVDGNMAMVAQRPDDQDTMLIRAYQRVASVWQPAPALNLTRGASRIVDMDLDLDSSSDQYRLLVSTESTTTAGGSFTIYRLDNGQWLQEFGAGVGNESGYGESVALADRIAVIGRSQFNNRGMVNVRRLDNDGNWSSVNLLPSSSQVGAGFGKAVAIVSGAVVVGAPDHDVTIAGGATRTDAGMAFVYELTQNTWSEVATFTAATPENTGRFGASVAISGLDEGTPDRMLIGAPREDGTDGAVYGYRRTSGVWAQSMRLTPEALPAFQQFGAALALDGAYAVIGADNYTIVNDQGPDDFGVGAIYGAVFNSSFTSATLTRRLDPVPEAQSRVGRAVAIDRSGPTVMAGAPNAELYGFNRKQGIVLYSRGSASERFPPLARVFDLGQGLYGAQFGRAIASDGDSLIVGAYGESVHTQIMTGAVYLFRRGVNGTYVLEARIPSPNGVSADLFGYSVALRGDSALVGAPGFDGSGTTDLGTVYALRRSNGVWQIEAQLSSRCASTVRSSFGRTLSFDGTQAMIGGICRPADGAPGLDLGTAVYTRQTDGTWTGTVANAVARMDAGTWDGGVPIVGHATQPNSSIAAGSVCAFFPDTNGPWNLASCISSGSSDPIRGFGYGVAAHNGLVAVTSHAPGYPTVLRRRTGTAFVPEAALIPNDLASTEAAQSVAVRGEQVLLGAHAHTVNLTSQGAAYLFQRSGGTWTQRQKLLSDTPLAGAHFGSSVVIADDGALIIGAEFDNEIFLDEGGVYIFRPPSEVLLKDGFE